MKTKKPHLGPKINLDPELVIGTREAARLLGVGEREVRYKIQRKKLPALKIGNCYFINARAPFFYLKSLEIRRPRWSANRAERLRRRAAENIISCADHTMNLLPGPASDNIITPACLGCFGEFAQENIETRPYLRSLPHHFIFRR